MSQATIAAPALRRRPRGRVLPYLLSLPALLICIGILIPFATAVWYSMQRYNLAFPMTRGMIWWGNYLDFLSDPSFWNTLKVSIAYMVLTVGVELLLGLGVALLLRRSTVFNNIMSIALMLPLMIAPGHRRADVEADDQSRFRDPQLPASGSSACMTSNGPRRPRRRSSPSCWSMSGSTRPSSSSCCWRACGRCRPSPSRRRISMACRGASSSSASRCRC